MGRKTPVVGIVGLGLIGGSLGLALRAAGGWRVLGYDSSRETRAAAPGLGACDEATRSVEDLSRRSDIVVIAVPTSRIPEVSLLAGRCMRPGSILTDTGSVKAPLKKQIVRCLPSSVQYVGGHPMAGSERSGLPAASPDLFRGRIWALTAVSGGLQAVTVVQSIVHAAGAIPLVVDAGEHDLAVAYSSHLPYLLAVALALTADEKDGDQSLVHRLLASGFRDSSRLARSEPSVAMDYCLVNRPLVLGAIAAFEKRLRSIKTALRAADVPALMAAAAQARGFLEGVSTEGWEQDGNRTSRETVCRKSSGG